MEGTTWVWGQARRCSGPLAGRLQRGPWVIGVQAAPGSEQPKQGWRKSGGATSVARPRRRGGAACRPEPACCLVLLQRAASRQRCTRGAVVARAAACRSIHCWRPFSDHNKSGQAASTHWLCTLCRGMKYNTTHERHVWSRWGHMGIICFACACTSWAHASTAPAHASAAATRPARRLQWGEGASGVPLPRGRARRQQPSAPAPLGPRRAAAACAAVVLADLSCGAFACLSSPARFYPSLTHHTLAALAS